MDEKWNQLSKVEKFCVILGVFAVVHLLTARDVIVFGIEALIIGIVFAGYKVVTNQRKDHD